MTWMADAVSESRSGRRDTELTSMAISCSRLSFLRAPGVARESGCWARARLTKMSPPAAAKIQLRAHDDGFATWMTSARKAADRLRLGGWFACIWHTLVSHREDDAAV